MTFFKNWVYTLFWYTSCHEEIETFFTEWMIFKRLVYIYLDVYDKKHMWDYSQTFRTNWTSPGEEQQQEQQQLHRGGEVVHGKDAPLRNELGSLPSSYSNFVFPQYRESRWFLFASYLPQFSDSTGIGRT